MTEYENVIKQLRLEIQKNLTTKRYTHTLNVEDESIKLAKKYGAQIEKSQIIALAHDRFRDIDNSILNTLIEKYDIDIVLKNNNALAHGWVASEYLKDRYKIHDPQILSSIRYHTTGRKNMDVYEKIVFLADAIEKGRNYPGVDKIREETKKGLDYGVRESLLNTIEYLKENHRHINKDTTEAFKHINEELKGD